MYATWKGWKNKMYSDARLKMWRVINTALLVAGMSLPWYVLISIEGDLVPTPAGWKSACEGVVWALGDIKSFGFDWYTTALILAGVGVVLVFLYLVYNVSAVIKKRNIRCKFLSFIFIGVNILFSVRLDRPVIGFWVISLGLLSSAVLEWVNARSADTQAVE
jgi:hypothetical protein